MRIIPAALTALLFSVSPVARAQGISVHGAAGPTLGDSGYSLAGGVGFSLTPG